jgi:hypothetical protein
LAPEARGAVKLLLLFLLATFLLAARATRRGRPIRTLPLLIATTILAASYYSLRFI